MAFVICDDHNASVEADEIEADQARRLVRGEEAETARGVEREIAEFGQQHRGCAVRVLAG